MTHRRLFLLLTIPVLAMACGGGKTTGSSASPGGGDSGVVDTGTATTDTGMVTTTDGSTSGVVNSTPMVVNSGPAGTGSINVPFISVTLCVPGTSNCQTIPYVSVDTGSTGLRILSSVLSPSLTLPQANATTGSPLAECYTFDDGYTWGSVRTADVKIAGEVAAKIPIHIIGDPAFSSVPAGCSSTGMAEDTLATFGSNGLIGINQIVADCGSFCSMAPAQEGAYYSCSGSTCTAVTVADANQLSNPIALFASDDKNGSVLQFPTVAAGGAASLAGALVFGIGTAANNALGSAQVLTVDGEGNFTTVYKGTTMSTSFLDSGTNTLSFNDSSIAQCTDAQGFLCPASPLSLSAQNVGRNNVMNTIMFGVESADTLFGNGSDAVFDDLATTGIDNNTFDWGLPFFVGRNVFVALQGASTPGGDGPYFAY